jgi:hypothetical protein
MTTNTPKPLVYPDAAARRLLGDHLGKGDKYRAERIAAGKALVQQLHNLLGDYNVVTERFEQGTGFIVHMPAQKFLVGVKDDREGTVIVDVLGGQKPAPLYFNPDTGLFEGQEVDNEVTPLPGQLRQRRSAMATIVAIIFGESPKD